MLDYGNCQICPRECAVDRRSGRIGFCGQSDKIVISTAALHFGEEPPISGSGGSGAIFFSGCTMGCPFCQNWQISRGVEGAIITVKTLSSIMLELQEQGAENINFVTGTHFIPSIKQAVNIAKIQGLRIPLVWNCSGYETLEAVENLNSFIDIYLPDYKTSVADLAHRLYNAKDYPYIAQKAISEMVKSRSLSFSENGNMNRGVLVRHLVLPGEMESSRNFIQWYFENLKGKALISIMVQYTPVDIPGNNVKIPRNHISQAEYDQLLDFLNEYNIEEGFFQDLETGVDWLPDFTKTIPFQSNKTKIIWSSVKNGFLR